MKGFLFLGLNFMGLEGFVSSVSDILVVVISINLKIMGISGMLDFMIYMFNIIILLF